uniref:ST8 alpha-N-acetyl-neuraminide alpha-2,8-sialyltransferase 6 n=1 Tax=Leptobrachium leishanense TaxID=445787 RepID=A0A8C5M8B1_9ANUR
VTPLYLSQFVTPIVTTPAMFTHCVCPKVAIPFVTSPVLSPTVSFPALSPLFCAVVANGGILLNSCCGSEIDRADYVFRFNLPPLNYSDDVGRKTNLVTAAPSVVYAGLNERRGPFVDLAKIYEPAMILMSAFFIKIDTDVSLKAYYALIDFKSQQKVVYLNPYYLSKLARYWKKKGLVVPQLSSGFMMINTALEICDKVTLYGFWPFSEDPNGKPIPHHYYDDRPPKPDVHSMPNEFFFYSRMYSKRILNLKVGKCF